MKTVSLLITCSLAFGLLLLAGCGSGGSSSLFSSRHGRAVVTVSWPQRSRLIPKMTNSIQVVLTDQQGVVGSQTLNRPADGSSSSSTFANLPVESLSVTATAYPTAGAQGVPLAAGTSIIAVIDGQATPIHITMNSTIDHLDIAPAATQTVALGGTLQLSIMPRDAKGGLVLIPTDGVIWSSASSSVATVSPQGLVSGLKEGTSVITAIEKESGIQAVVTITVTLTLGGQVTWATGVLNSATVWSGTVHVTGDVTVPVGASLNVTPGTKVIFEANSDDQIGGVNVNRCELIVDGGTMTANGTSAQPILFTSAATNPQKGDWYGLRVKTNASLTMSNCVEEYGTEGIYIQGGTQALSSCTFRKNSDCGVNSAVSVNLDTLTLTDNNNFGVYVVDSSLLTIADSTISGCTNGNYWQSAGVWCNNGTIKVTNCDIFNNAAHGVFSQRDGNSNSITASNCRIHDNGIYGLCGSNITVDSCPISRCQRGVEGNWVTMSNCQVTACSYEGIGSDDWNSWLNISNSTVSDNGYSNTGPGTQYCMLVNASAGCVFNNNAGWGIQRGGTIDNCTITNNHAGGVNNYNNSTLIVTNSTVMGNTGDGINLAYTVTNCKVTGNSGIGARIGTPTTSTSITGNLLYGNRVGLQVASSATTVTVSGNDIYGNAQYEIYNEGTAAVMAAGNYFSDPTITELVNHITNLSRIYDSRDNQAVGQVAIPTWASARVTSLSNP